MGSVRERFAGGLSITPRMAVALSVTLVALSLALAFMNERASRNDAIHQAQVQARILAESTGGALAFEDAAATQGFVNAFRANPAVEAAAAYDAAGRRVAAFRRGGVAPPNENLVGAPRVEGQRISVTAPVTQGTAPLGSVYVRVIMNTWPRRLARYVGIGGIVLMAALLVAFIGASHGRLREANERLQLEIREREKAEEALRQSQKMEAMGQLTGGVAHDFNNLLMVASSGLDLMDRTADPIRRDRLKQGIRQAIDRGASLTQQLLAFARRAPVKPEVVNPRNSLMGMRELLDRSLREDVTVELQPDDDLWPIEVDASALEVAVLNSAINARDAMPNGGTITVKAYNLPASDDHPFDRVCICIIDTGLGAPPEIASRVFEPFFTTKGVGQGTGLGLSQVYGFARSSGGDVEFISEVGKGSTVCMRIPRSTKVAPPNAHAQPAAAEPHGRQCRVLLVEDDDNVAELVTQMLVELGYEPTRAPNAASALERLQMEHAFDLVFSDMVMPGEMNGLQLAEEILSRSPNLPVILTTGYSAAAASAAAKGIRLLVKPYRIEALASELDAALSRSSGATTHEGVTARGDAKPHSLGA